MTMRFWIRKLFTCPAVRTIHKAPRRGRLTLEALEARCLPSTFTVNNPTDTTVAGQTDLREAIALANSNPGADTINFDSTVFATAQTITLGGTQLELSDTTGATTITGPAAGVTISGNNLSRVFQVDAGASAAISGLTITGGHTTADGGGLINSGMLTLSGCTFSNNSTAGLVPGSGNGGGLDNTGTATLSGCTFFNNTSISGYVDSDNGGGLFNSGTVTVSGCTFSTNTTYNEGGGLFNSGTATVSSCTFSNNAWITAGGGVYNAGTGTATLTNCTISGTLSSHNGGYGGGVYNAGAVTLTNCTLVGGAGVKQAQSGGGLLNDGTATLTNCTVTNETAAYGGGVESGGTVTLTNCTVTDNHATGRGGGINMAGGVLTMANSILANNFDSFSNYENLGFPVSGVSLVFSNNLFGDNPLGIDGPGAVIGDPMLLPLGNYGGPTQTIPLKPGSPAIDAGSNAALTLPSPTLLPFATATTGGSLAGNTTFYYVVSAINAQGETLASSESSQTTGSGSANTVTVKWNAVAGASGYRIYGRTQGTELLLGTVNSGTTQFIDDGSLTPSGALPSSNTSTLTTDQRGLARIVNGVVDIGAVESQGSLTLSVSTTSDENDGNYTFGHLSLREAVDLANLNPGPDTIIFDPNVFSTAQTITLGGTQLELSDTSGATTIIGPAAGVTISGNNLSRVFQIDASVAASFSGLTITGGSATTPGGGLNNAGTATLTNCTVSENSGMVGGGLYNAGTATLTNCTVSGNTSALGGGGMTNKGGTATLTNCTFSGNSAVGGGGLTDNGGTVTLTNCTVSGNTAGSNGGGGLNNLTGSTLRLVNTVVAGNVNTAGTIPDVKGAFTSQGNNLIGKTDGSSGWIASDLTGTIALPKDPLLDPLGLGNNGGPTQTIALQSGSPAIDNGTAKVFTTLTAAIADAVTTSITVASTTGLGIGLYVQIDSEILLITGVSNATTLTVVRGQLGTTAAAHTTTGVNVTLAADQRGAAYVGTAPDIGAFEFGGVTFGVALNNDTGSSGTDHITSDGTLNVTGVGSGAVVQYSIDSGASWSGSFTPIEGANSVQVRVVDVAGNPSAPTTFTFTLDTVAAAPVVALANDTGSSNTDGITSDGTLDVTGVESGALVEYSIDSGAHWSTTFNAVEGPNSVQVRQTDIAGNVSAATTFTFTLDTTPPNVANVSSTTPDGSYKAGSVISITVTFNQAVTVTGVPRLTLDTGTTDELATYTGGSGTNTLTFTYTVQPGDTSADLDYTSTDLDLNGGSIQDLAGNDAILTLPADSTGHSLADNKNLVIDTTAPAAPGVALLNDTGISGDLITSDGRLNIASENDAVVEYSTDGVHWSTTFTPVQGPNLVQVRQTDVAGNVSPATSFSFVLDTTAAAPGVALTNDTGTSSSDRITSDGTLTLSGVETGALVEYSTDGGAHWSTTFTAVEGANSVQVRQTDIADNVSAPSAFTFTLDTIAPTVTDVSSTTANGSYSVGSVITITVTFDSVVFVTGTPQLTLETGTTDRVANYTVGSGTNTLTFTYTVQSGDQNPDLDYASTSALVAGGSVRDTAGNNANLTLPADGTSHSLSDNKNLVIDTSLTPAVANTDLATTAEGTAVTISVLANDGGSSPSIQSFTNGGSGIVSQVGNQLVYTPNAHFNGTDLFGYTITNVLGGTSTASVVVIVTAVNDAPVVTVSAPTQTYFANLGGNAVTGISIADVDVGTGSMNASLSVPHGTLTLGIAGVPGLPAILGLTITGTGSATSPLSITGPLASVNAALSSVSYVPALNFDGQDTLTVTANDLGNSGAGGPQTNTQTVTLKAVASQARLQASPITAGKTDLVVYGTSGNDTILVTPSGTSVKVTIGTTVLGTFAPTGRIVVFAGDGNDIVTVSATITRPVYLQGDAGNDTLTGGGGSDVLSGGAGTNILKGGLGTNRVVETGDVNFTLTNTAVTDSAGNSDTLSAITQATLTGGASNNTFTVTGWTRAGATINGGGGNDTIVSVKNANFTLTNSALTVSTGGTFTLSGIAIANLTGGTAANTFTVTGWTGAATLVGGGGVDRVVAGDNSTAGNATFILTNGGLVRSGAGTGGTFNLSGITRATLTGGKGNNVIDASAFTLGSVVLSGGTGGNDILAGGSGADTLTVHGTGRNILIGGAGADILTGSTGQDILIDGTTTLNLESPAFAAILSQWVDPLTLYAARVTALRTSLVIGTTVLNDTSVDTLTGGVGSDWFFASPSGSTKDKTDRSGPELVN